MSWNTATRVGLSVTSGVVLALSFPNFDLSLLAWVAFVPLLYLTNDQPLGRVFSYAWLQNFSCFAVSLYWIVFTLHHFAGVHYVFAIWPEALLAGAIACFAAVAFWASYFVSRRLRIPLLIALPVIWTAIEWIHSFFPIGFPWNLLGYSAYRNLDLIQFAEFTGVYGISFLIILFNVIVYTVLFQWESRKVQIWSLGVLSVLMIAAFTFGNFRISELRRAKPMGTLRVALAQGNIAQSIKWNPESEPETFKIYLDQTAQAARDHADLVVWPETADPFFFQPNDAYPIQFAADRAYRDQLLDQARANGVNLLFGAPALGMLDGRLAIANRAYLVSSQGQIIDYYDKVQLVPFGEYVPLKTVLGFIVHRIVTGFGELIPGKRQTVFEVKSAKLSVLVCYESIFPDLTRREVSNGAKILFNLSNDGWYGKTAAPHQLLAMASMRAVENKVPMVRVANTGISAIVLPDGEIVDKTPLFERVMEIEPVAWGSGGTVYSAVGDLFSEICSLLAIAALLGAWFWPRKMNPLEAAVSDIIGANGQVRGSRAASG